MKMSDFPASPFNRYFRSQTTHSRLKPNLTHWLAALLLMMAGTANAVVATVELQILNATDSNGDIVVVAGTAVEVGFNVIGDPSNELDKKDEIQLLNVADDAVVSSKQRGNAETGSVSLKVPNGPVAQFYVRYVLKDQVTIVATAADPSDPNSPPLVGIAEANIEELSARVATLEGGDIDPLNEVQSLSTDGTSLTLSSVDGVGGGNIPLPQGPAGPQGETGSQGSIGLTGATGSTGATGPQGPAGADGTDGADGPQGIQGIQGEEGPAGPQGNPGIAGTNGINGADGTDGLAGAQGSAGADGATGPQGPAGADGAGGAPGTDGVDGLAGLPGPQGDPGVDGQDGLPGIDGLDGEQGPAGINCWDVNSNNINDIAEDTNNDGTFNTLDCVVNTELSDLILRILVLEARLENSDFDNDGFTPATGDCDDSDAMAYPQSEFGDDCEVAYIPTYKLGDTGPAGGWVFSVTEDGLHGLEVALTIHQSQGGFDNTEMWGCLIPVLGTQAEIGTGEDNTNLLVNGNCNALPNAAIRANEYTQNGFDDYYLPSKDELMLLFEVMTFDINTENTLSGYAYWTSTDFGNASQEAWTVRLDLDTLAPVFDSGAKGELHIVAPIRAF